MVDYKKAKLSERRVGHMIGNAMSCCVLERLLPKVLDAIGISPAGPCHDRWAQLVGSFAQLAEATGL